MFRQVARTDAKTSEMILEAVMSLCTWDEATTENSIDIELRWNVIEQGGMSALLFATTLAANTTVGSNYSAEFVLPDYYIPAGSHYQVIASAHSDSTKYQRFSPITITSRDAFPRQVNPSYPFNVSLSCEDEGACADGSPVIASSGESITVKWTKPAASKEYAVAEVMLYWGNPLFYNQTSSWGGRLESSDSSIKSWAPDDGKAGVKFLIDTMAPESENYYIAVVLHDGGNMVAIQSNTVSTSLAGLFTIQKGNVAAESASPQHVATVGTVVAGALMPLLGIYGIL